MNSRRLARLMGIICEIKAHPRRSPEEMCQRFKISRRQFYKDREELEQLGFKFHYSRRSSGFLLDKELTFPVGGMSLADLFALVLAVRELTRLSDFSLAMGALTGLNNLVQQLPEQLRSVFGHTVDQVVVADGFGCEPEVLYTLMQALQVGRRVALEMTNAQEQGVMVDPKRLLLSEGALFLEAEGLEPGGPGLVALSRVRKVILTPFYSPQPGPGERE